MIITINEEMLKIDEAINYLASSNATIQDMKMVFEVVQKKHPVLFDKFVDKFWTMVGRKGGTL